jgi:FkbM family methyltransferase
MTSGGRMAQLFLRYATPFAGVRRWPVLGPAVGWISALLVPRDSLAWMQVERGPAAGLWLQLNPRTGRIVLEGGGEPEAQAALVQHLRPGMTFYDVGANIGFFSLLAARLVGPAGHVVSFEADPEIAARLRANAGKNLFSWINVEQQAVCAEPCDVFFQRADAAISPDRGVGHIVAAESANAIRVPGISLDEYTRAVPPPDFVKCDVEGAEIEVFRGAAGLLREKRPGILCEMHGEENRRALETTFTALGYHCRMLDQNHLLALPR